MDRDSDVASNILSPAVVVLAIAAEGENKNHLQKHASIGHQSCTSLQLNACFSA